MKIDVGGFVVPDLLEACKLAYRKHKLEDDSVGWNELESVLFDALCEEMGDDGFYNWLDNLGFVENADKSLQNILNRLSKEIGGNDGKKTY